MAGILLIIFIAYIYSTSKKIDKLEKENLLLKKEIKTLKEGSPKEEVKIENTVVSKVEPTYKEKKVKQKVDSVEQKNTTILITGAILIILAAIVFLTSTWNAIPNVLKTLVMILLVGVFLGASKIAKNKFHLEKTSNTFFYMAMAYIPICLLSCSIFGLFGEFLSIYGDGNYIYLTGTAIFTSIIYFISYKNRKSNGLVCASLIAQVSAVVLFTLIFEYNIELMLINLLVYNLLLLLLSRNNDVGKIGFVKNLYKAIPYIVGFITIFFMTERTLKIFITLVLLGINYLLLYRRKEEIILNAYLFNFITYFLGIYIFWSKDNLLAMDLQVLYQMLYVLIIFIAGCLLFTSNNDKALRTSSMVMSIIFMSYIYIDAHSYDQLVIKPYIVAIIDEILLLIAFKSSKENGKKLLSFLIPICGIIIGREIIEQTNQIYHYYILFSILIFIIGEMIRNKILNKGFFIISHIYIGFTYLVFSIIKYKEFSNDIIYFIILLAIYSYSFMKNKNIRIFKYLSYITAGACLYSGAKFLELEDNAILLIPVILSITIRVLEKNYEFLRDRFSIIFKTIYELIAYSCLMSISTDSRIVFTTLFAVYLSCISLYKRKISTETISSGIYLFFSMYDVESVYIKEIFCLIWAGMHYYFITNSKENDIFKGILYICGCCLYNTILEEIGLDEYYSFYMIGVTIVALLFTKTIIYKYVKQIDNIEYLVFGLIYLIALCSYASEKDGMIYVLALVGLVIYSYTKKYGAIFIVSTLAIIVNAIALTREFWLSVPWWIYLLLVGTTLIAFAIKNESNENKEKISVGKVVKKIKDNIEK